MDYTIRPLTNEDEPVLWEMLYQVLRTSENAPPREIVRKHEYSRHVAGWGRPGDSGFVAFDRRHNDDLLGAAWFRLPSEQPQEGSSPELAFAVISGHRKRGIGTVLLTQLVKTHPHYDSILLSASPKNPAVRLFD